MKKYYQVELVVCPGTGWITVGTVPVYGASVADPVAGKIL
jgi:hypothetical protein